MYLRELEDNEFETFAYKNKMSSLYQSKEYADIMSNEGYSSKFVGLIDNDNIVGASLILIKKDNGFNKAYAPGGFLVDYCDENLLRVFTDTLKRYLSDHDVITLTINPRVIKEVINAKNNSIEKNKDFDSIFYNLKKFGYKHLGYNDFFENHHSRFESVIVLNKDIYKLFSNITKKFRTKLRSAENYGVKIYKGKDSDLEYLYKHTYKKYPHDINYFTKCLNTFDKNNKIDIYYAKLDTNIYLEKVKSKYEYLEKENSDINHIVVSKPNKNSKKLIARKMNSDRQLENAKKSLIQGTSFLRKYPDGFYIASAMIIKYKKEAYLLMDGYEKECKKINAKHLLYWKLIEKYNRLGYDTFNLGETINPNSTSDKYKGLIEFKQNFGANTYEYIGNFELITNSALYFIYNKKMTIKNIFDIKK